VRDRRLDSRQNSAAPGNPGQGRDGIGGPTTVPPAHLQSSDDGPEPACRLWQRCMPPDLTFPHKPKLPKLCLTIYFQRRQLGPRGTPVSPQMLGTANRALQCTAMTGVPTGFAVLRPSSSAAYAAWLNYSPVSWPNYPPLAATMVFRHRPWVTEAGMCNRGAAGRLDLATTSAQVRVRPPHHCRRGHTVDH